MVAADVPKDMNDRTPTVGFVSLGCPKALVDSERILSQLRAEGYQVSGSYDAADVVVVNTCGFIDAAVQESFDAIAEAVSENGKVIVTGCLGVDAERIRDRFPDVLAVTGPDARAEVVGAIHHEVSPPHDPFQSLLPPGGIKLTPRHYAYLKISEGCNHRCTFCIIPSMRGPLVSRPVSEVLREAEALVTAGVKELLVVSQDTSAYGVDTRYAEAFFGGRSVRGHVVDLARELGQLGAWVRLHYIYPYPHVDQLIPLMAEGLLLPYLDVPFQHAVPRVLKAMKRPANSSSNLERILRWRETCPDLTLRSTFIVGFPGETDDDFEELIEFVEAAEIDRVGCFCYSPVDGASANDLPDPVPEEVKQERQARLMTVQEKISALRLKQRVGNTESVIVDHVEDGVATARSKGDAPEIDGLVHIENGEDLRPGDIVPVRIIDSDNHDLRARAES